MNSHVAYLVIIYIMSFLDTVWHSNLQKIKFPWIMWRKNISLCIENERSCTDNLYSILNNNKCNYITKSKNSVYDDDHLENFVGYVWNSYSDDEIIVCNCKTMLLNISSCESKQLENEGQCLYNVVSFQSRNNKMYKLFLRDVSILLKMVKQTLATINQTKHISTKELTWVIISRHKLHIYIYSKQLYYYL